MSTALDLRCLMMSLAMPAAVTLSVCMGVAGWGCPSSSRVVQSVVASCPLKEKGTEFSFGGASYNHLHDVGDNEDGAIGWFGRVAGNNWLVVAKVMKTSGTGARFRFGEVRRVAVHLQYRVAGGVMNYSVRMSGRIVEELGACFGGRGRAFGLGGCKSAEAD
jgi:hypothetical protein